MSKMEVETQQSMSSFDLQSKSPHAYSPDTSNIVRVSDSNTREFRASVSDSKVGPKCEDILESFAMIGDGGGVGGDPDPYAVMVGSTEQEPKACDVNAPTDGASCDDLAAVKLQKVYRSYRTRRRLADSVVVAEELWWQAIDYARLNHSTISFFNLPESAASRWSRISLNASKVGKGLSKDAKAQKLAFQHWIEAIDPRHRYGHSLHLYYEEWCKTDAGQPFFYWLDIGDGKDLDLEDCPRSKLRQQCIKYLGPQEREHFEYIVVEEKIICKQTGDLLDTNRGSQKAKWIFVMSTTKKLYAGEKKKGLFHHSSFLAGGATIAAGRLVAEHGVLKSISPYSGHYRPTDDSFESFLSFLKENGVNLTEVQINKASEDSDVYDDGRSYEVETIDEAFAKLKPPKLEIPEKNNLSLASSEVNQTETTGAYKRTLSGGLQSPTPELTKTAILERINSKKAAKSYQLGHKLSRKWSTGAGPRIGCVADYPPQLRDQALEFVNLSPRTPPTPSSNRRLAGLTSPTTPLASSFPSLPSSTVPTTSNVCNGEENSSA